MSGLVVSVGELLIDFVPGQPGVSLRQADSFRKSAGGAPANVAAVVARLGGRSAFIGRVGNDPFGHFLRDTLAACGVDTRAITLDPQAQTTLAFVSLAADADRDFSFYRNGTADTRLAADDLDRELIREASVLHFCSISLSHEPARGTTFEAARLAREAGALVSFDVNWRPPLWDSETDGIEQIHRAIGLVDVLKLSEDELELLTGSRAALAARDLLNERLRLVLLSRGAEGVQVITDQEVADVPAWNVEPVDTTGAGDALAGAVLLELAGGTDLLDPAARPALLEAVRRANAAAALSTLKPGAIDSYPDLAELEAFLDQA